MGNKSQKIYFAGPLFNEAERRFNELLTVRLEQSGFEVFLPQRDGVERNMPPYDTMEPDKRRKTMFEFDRNKILESDIFLFVLDGRVPDEGACVELGIAYADKFLNEKNRILIGFQTDVRAAFMGSKLNPMLKIPLDYIATSEEQLMEYLRAS
ncbi:MAG: nucleoside 2-deoxyribosyltransferase [Candidatus Sungbacteria bacterium]|nr:nucleoside 2-deoxyribosyltransferase [Candidatus Sungbacteria bacterium]